MATRLSSTNHYLDVTELAGSQISLEQLDRLVSRYAWAASLSRGKDVVELACGTGPGLGLLSCVSRSLEAGDYSQPILEIARSHYGNRVSLAQIDAEELPFPDSSKDVVILFEALYYLLNPESFVKECRRVLRRDGIVLISTANKDLWDFHPSPHTHRYFGVVELAELFRRFGFECDFSAFQEASHSPLRQRLLRPLKRIAVDLGLMPRTMKGKRWLKRIVFGKEMSMPAELTAAHGQFTPPTPIPADTPDRRHKIVYCVASRM